MIDGRIDRALPNRAAVAVDAPSLQIFVKPSESTTRIAHRPILP